MSNNFVDSKHKVEELCKHLFNIAEKCRYFNFYNLADDIDGISVEIINHLEIILDERNSYRDSILEENRKITAGILKDKEEN